jgi:sigma-B regulation protein RsbU (phosphoserine phosphatase)
VESVTGIGKASVSGAFAGLLALTGDAVLAFDGAGVVLLANEEARRLFQRDGDFLVGLDVRGLFPPAVGVTPGTPFSLAALPFSCDGTSAHLVIASLDGTPARVVVRCDSVRAPGDTYLLVAHRDDSEAAVAAEHDRLVSELSEANRRLSGTLGIVLGTLDSPDVGTLFERVLDGIDQTMGATGTMVYIAESDGFHLRAMSDGVDGARTTQYLPYSKISGVAAARMGQALRLRVLSASTEDLRRGRLSAREVLDEETHETYRVDARLLPPFTSFLVVPVWFGGRVISVILVGWKAVHPTKREDARLLDAVGQYLSVQLMGAFAAMLAQRKEHLAARSTELRERLMAADTLDAPLVASVLADAADELDARFVRVCLGPAGSRGSAVLSDGRRMELPADAGAQLAEPARDGREVAPLDAGSPLGRALVGWGEDLTQAVVVDVGRATSPRWAFVLARGAGAEPFEDGEVDFLRRLADDVRDLAQGREQSARDKRISQALQSGMRNELQEVEGISAQGLYSSATASAFVGGDFYDLVRLPGRRACVIMGDVSGKGVEAASVSAAVKTALGAYAWEGLTPARMVRSLNDFLLGFSRVETFATLFVGLVDLDEATITYCSAGHPPAILMRSRTGEYATLNVQSGVVGAFADMAYQDGVEAIEKGDMLLLYTDGTTEARSPEGDFFGEDGLREAVMREAAAGFEGICDRLLATLDAFTDNSLDDDVAMVALRFDGVGPQA